MRMHFFASAASLFNVLACVDLKGYSARQPLLLTETFNELAFSCVLCVLFHMVNQWVDVITLGGRTEWGKRQHALLPWMCGLVAVLRVGLGLAQWLAVPKGLQKGRYNGTLNGLKLITTFVAVAFYTAIGMYASIYQPMQKKRAQSRPSHLQTNYTASAATTTTVTTTKQAPGLAGAGGHLSSISAKLSKKKVLNTYYLVGLFVILFFYCIYLAVEAVERFGEVEQRNVPCSSISKNWFTNQGTILILVGLYMSMKAKEEGDPAKGGGCSLPSSPEQRRQRRLAAARKKQEAVRLEAEKERKAKDETKKAQEVAVERAMMMQTADVEAPRETDKPRDSEERGSEEDDLAFENPSTVLVDQRSGKRTSSLSLSPTSTSSQGQARKSTTSSVGLVEVELTSAAPGGDAAAAQRGTMT
eukprot:CAMPEP_0171717746 /NCGR_PEP_ID=MMETSP0991-20121206/20210_1 /TAXON_ID=483369 /ORGANISM="non described non described, Strain CCMP2098" /LENGTH=414 /DNA_ID=CAMNT_0012309009 /DNA_START=199 /DNA_END=1443 /DNA_ORIENTATION=-